MKWRWFPAAMVLLNFLLFAVVLWQASVIQQLARPAQPPPVAQIERHDSPVENNFTVARRKLLANPAFAPLAARSTTESPGAARPAFDRRLLESADYRAYINELRASGSPEDTLRDIVTMDVVNGFAARCAEVMAGRFRDFKFWEARAMVRSEMDPARRTVDAEMAAVLRALIGQDTPPPDTARAWQHAEWEQQLAFLPADRRAPTLEVLVRHEEIAAQYKLLADDKQTEGADKQEIVKGYQQRRDELTRLLSPEEFAQLDMTVSWTADNLRRAMVKFQPTESEFRAIFREWRAQDENLGLTHARGEPSPGNQQVFDKIRALLGEKRYAEYRQAWWK